MISDCMEKYSPKTLSSEEKEILEKGMAEAFSCFKKTACDLYGFANIKKLRNDYKKNSSILKSHPAAQQCMDWLISKESTIISGYILMCYKICKSFAKSKNNKKLLGSPSFDDFLQEAVIAIYESMYLYNGETKFLTYAYWAVKNRLIRFNNNNQKINGFDKTIADLKKKVLIISNNDSITQEQAVKKLVSVERIDFDTVERLKFSLDLGSSGIVDISKHQIKKEEKKKDYFEKMKKAISETKLSDLERQLVEAHLKGDSEFRRSFSETINPNTGKKWTKQRLSQIFVSACEKIRKVYNSSKAA